MTDFPLTLGSNPGFQAWTLHVNFGVLYMIHEITCFFICRFSAATTPHIPISSGMSCANVVDCGNNLSPPSMFVPLYFNLLLVEGKEQRLHGGEFHTPAGLKKPIEQRA